METETKEKLNILNNVGTINNDELTFIEFVDKKLQQANATYPKKDEMLLIHLAVTMERIRKKSLIEKMPEEISEQVKAKKEYPAALNFWDEVRNNSPVVIPEQETDYIVMHIVNIMEER